MIDAMATAPSNEQVLAVLRTVQEPELKRDIVSLSYVRNVKLEGGQATVGLELPQPSAKHRAVLEQQIRAVLERMPGIEAVTVKVGLKVGVTPPPERNALADVGHLVAVASGKGGVGKSTVAVNLALALKSRGARVGLLDCDIYGPSIPIMLGARGAPQQQGNRILPLEAYGLKLMSIGFLTGEEAPVIWRGPMVHNIVSQFLSQIEWGELDHLILDLPPGTGDAQLTLTQAVRLSGAVIVTTPQPVALEDVYRGVRMFEQVKVPILGVVENMSYYECSQCGHRDDIFAHGGGKAAAQKYGVPFLGEIPLLPAIREAGDAGTPIVVRDPQSTAAQAYQSLAASVQEQLAHAAAKAPTIKL
jgi:ATP-binding protein involved in chromosome partitioning